MAVPIRYNVLSLLARPVSTISSVLLIAIVIASFAYLQAVTDSALRTMTATGDSSTLIVMSRAATSETTSGLGKDGINKLDLTPDVERRGDRPILSPELVSFSSAFGKSDPDVALNVAVRGVDFDAASAARRGRVRILEGRAFEPGREEAIVGNAVRRAYLRHEIGDKIEIGTRGERLFTIVGVFTTDGTAADSEIWGYSETLRDAYGRDSYSSARMLVADETAAERAIAFINGPEVQLNAKTERKYFSDLGTNEATTQVFSVIMIVIMGAAAAFAVANTMYAAVAGRVREIGMLRAIGFARRNILTAFLLEGLLLALAGGVLGVLASLAFNGVQMNMLPETFTTVSYDLRVTPKVMFISLAVSLAIGLVGTIMPAWRAARMSVTSALRDA